MNVIDATAAFGARRMAAVAARLTVEPQADPEAVRAAAIRARVNASLGVGSN